MVALFFRSNNHLRGACMRFFAFLVAGAWILVSCSDAHNAMPTRTDLGESKALNAAVGGESTTQQLVVRVLDVGQGDATVITNGSSNVVIDGGADLARFRVLVDSLSLNNATIDAIIVSHAHTDHASGLRALFERNRRITVRYYFDNGDPTASTSHQQLRDSANARAARGELIYRDTDDPCGDGSLFCTLTLNGGAKLHVMRPNPNGSNVDNRSTPVKLVGPDSASFTMWFAGDARYEAINWFIDNARYDLVPGIKVNVLKGQEHGNCRAITARFLRLSDPDLATFSLTANNATGLVHNETKDLLAASGKSWYRTDQNGSITFVSPGLPGGGYSVSVNRGSPNASGPADVASGSMHCVWPLLPAAPSSLTATAASSSEIQLSWTDNANNETGFRIERRSIGDSFIEIATAAANTTTFSNTGLAPSTIYEYRVRAFNEGGNSSYSNIASATTPSAPLALTLSVVGFKDKGFHKADLTWGGTIAQRVDIYRDGERIATVDNTGHFRDNINNRGSQSYTHWICESGTFTCSNVTTTDI
jgi:beta-lactamase superfamily II metal-dependent hydrolase